MAFEQNQQNGLNLGTGFNQVRQFQAELDKATASIGAAELAAEEKQLALKLKNLATLQQAKLNQLDQLIAMEEAGIKDLARLKLTLSERQFAVRKKEIQRELKFAKAAAEEFFKFEAKQAKKSTSSSKKSTSINDITAKAKPVKVTGKDSSTVSTELVDLVRSIDDTLASLHDVVSDLSKPRALAPFNAQQDIPKVVPSAAENIQTLAAKPTTEQKDIKQTAKEANNVDVPPNNPAEPQVAQQKPPERTFSDDSKGMKAVDLGQYAFEDVKATFESLLSAIELQDNGVKNTLNDVLAKGKENNSQAAIDLAGALLDNFEAAEIAVRKLREFNENKTFNKRITQLSEEQKLRASHETTAFANITAKIAAEAAANDLEHNKKLYLQEEEARLQNELITEQNRLIAELYKTEATLAHAKAKEEELLTQESQKLRNAHAMAEHKATIDSITARAKADDLEHNRALFEQEETWALEKVYIDKQNSLVEAQIKAEADLAYTNAHKKELLEQEAYKLRTALTEAEFAAIKEELATSASIAFTNANKAKLLEIEEHKLRNAHSQAEHEAIQEELALTAKAKDLQHNRELKLQEEKWALERSFIEAQNKLIEDRIKTEAALIYTGANRDKLIAQEEQKLKNEHASASLKAMQANIAAVAKADELEHNKKLYAQEEYRAIRIAYLEEQNKLSEEQIHAEAKLKFVRNNEERILDQEAHKLRIGHINAEHEAMNALIAAQAKKEDIENNRPQYLEEALQKLKVEHANKENELRLAGINAEAKAEDLKNNREAYALEARLARENAFYEERNRLEEERINAETELAWEKAHSDEILAQELQKKRLGYLKEYQEYQKKAGKYAVSQEEFEKNKAKKELASSKEDAVSGITEAIKTGQFSKIWSADNKEAYTKYMGQRTAELEEAYMAKFEAKNPEATEDERAEAKAKAEASAKLTAQFELVADAARDLAQTLNAQTDKIGAKQAPIDTRLQGSQVNDKILGSYWKQLARDMNKIGAVNPYFTQEDFANNIETLVNKGISFDIKQRAFLMTIQEKIANTFNAADGTLLRLIRIQQQDTTAGRLGMESALNSFLNSMYETSEYLTDVAASVRGSLEEMQALMEGAAGTELEFQVQKWMGSLYSVGMSQDAVQSIAQAFGQIASGDVSGLTGNGTGNLLIMAANEAGKSIADILQDGLDAKETNELMQAMVNYLAEIAETSNDSRVVQQQLANVYGLKASDLKAATNLASSIKDVSKQDLTYSGMLGQLNKMANSMILRTSTGEMLSNVWGNVQYTMATQMSNDPILYLLPRVATLLEDYAGGIDIPFLNVMGFGVDLNTSVAQLMNVAAMSGSILGALGPMVSGLASAASGSVMLNLAGINTSGKAPVIARGSAQPLQHLSGSSISESGYIGNSSGDDVKNATLQDAEDSKKKQMVEAKDEESSDDVVIRSQQAIIDIYNLLEEVAHGSQSLRVRLVNNNGGNQVYGQQQENETPTAPGILGGDNGNWVLSF